MGAAPEKPLDGDGLAQVLTTALPDGVRQEGTYETMCTVVADLTAGEVMFVPGRFASGAGEVARVKIDELLAAASMPAPPESRTPGDWSSTFASTDEDHTSRQ